MYYPFWNGRAILRRNSDLEDKISFSVKILKITLVMLNTIVTIYVLKLECVIVYVTQLHSGLPTPQQKLVSLKLHTMANTKLSYPKMNNYQKPGQLK